MLASIHPLGERARHNRWGLTMAAHLLGSWAGAVLVFGALGVLGTVVRLPVAVAVPATLLAAGWELSGRRVPGPRRQVNEDWLNRYRGWVYGVGFGFQLGAAVLTIVTSAALYLALFLTFIGGHGLIPGTVYGVGRAVPLLLARRVDRREKLVALHTRVQKAARPVRLGSVAALTALALVVR